MYSVILNPRLPGNKSVKQDIHRLLMYMYKNMKLPYSFLADINMLLQS